uniref:TRP C-terminal domain-containing protein n=1 Tax=Amphimedon queenslandica TaxID=400682 RepID=A0A1X7UX42_AMPQE
MLFVYLLLLCLFLGNEAHPHEALSYDPQSQSFVCELVKGHRRNTGIFEDIRCIKDDRVKMSPMTCVSFDNETNRTVGSLCPYFQDSFNVSIENESDPFCNHINRSGLLCSQCDGDYRLPLNSYSLKCKPSSECHSYHWILFFLVETSPVTIMFIIFMFWNVKLTAGYANCYIAYSQIISLQINTLSMTHSSKMLPHGTVAVSIVLSMYRVWSFQVGHVVSSHLCVHSDIGQLTTVALQYTSVFYALLLAFIGYVVVELHSHQFRLVVWISKPFSWCLRFRDQSVDPKTVALNTLAGFYYMAFAKLAAVSLFLLATTRVYNETGHVIGHVCFYDGSMSFMKNGHLKYAILAIAVLIFLVFVPVLFMTFYQFRIIQTCLSKWHLNRSGLIIFMDALQGCYKDGSDGGKDCRWFSSCFYMIRFAVFFLYSLILNPRNLFELQFSIQCILIVSLVVILCLNPYKYKWYNKLDVFIIAYSNFITSIVVYQFDLNSLSSQYPSSMLEVIFLLLVSLPLFCATIYSIKMLFGSRIEFLYHLLRRKYLENRNVLNNASETFSTRTFDEEIEHRSLTRIISDGSLPDRVLQPSRYNSSNSSPIYYGAISQNHSS